VLVVVGTVSVEAVAHTECRRTYVAQSSASVVHEVHLAIVEVGHGGEGGCEDRGWACAIMTKRIGVPNQTHLSSVLWYQANCFFALFSFFIWIVISVRFFIALVDGCM